VTEWYRNNEKEVKGTQAEVAVFSEQGGLTQPEKARAASPMKKR